MPMWGLWTRSSQGAHFSSRCFRVRVGCRVLKGAVREDVRACARREEILQSSKSWSLIMEVFQ